MASEELKPYTNQDLFDIAMHRQSINPLRVLATYANPESWSKIYDEKGCHWVWSGPVICAFELAQWGLTSHGESDAKM